MLKPGGRLAILEFAIPTTPLFRAAYLSYFRHILPRIGRLDLAVTTRRTATSQRRSGRLRRPTSSWNLLRKLDFMTWRPTP